MNKLTEADKSAKRLLLQLEEELANRLESLSADMSKSHDADSSEQAVERENDEVIVQLENDTRVELQQVRHTLQRLEQGDYRICTKCEEDISAARLQAIPYSTLCINCADS